uniref:keratin, type I cytoskeletal 9-like n=1 Tax=Podarcis muralis TaxID=64176 RepID=UPI00109F48B2|nr:keratin, type I cytoskeletal 9-like [Podarcis muralis]
MRESWAAWSWVVVLLVALVSEPAFCRRGGGRGGGGGSGGSKSGGSSRGGFHSLPKSSSSSSGQSSSSSRGAKVAGAAAVGAAVGYGLSSLGRSRFSRGGQGSSSAGKHMLQPGFQNPNWSDPMMEGELYSQAAKDPRAGTLLTFSPVVWGVTCLLLQG